MVASLLQPISPERFISRAIFFTIALAFVQFFHLMYLTISDIDVLLTWLFIYSGFGLYLFVYYKLFTKKITFYYMPYQFLFVIIIIGFIGKLISKYKYIESVLTVGLYLTRTNPEMGAGGISTYFAVWFYPAIILLFFVPVSRQVYIISLIMMSIVMLSEFIFVGTRGGPILVFLFLLFSKKRKYTKKFLTSFFFLFIVFIGIFSYSTTNRTQASALGKFSWADTLTSTISTNVVAFKSSVINACDKDAEVLFPVIFLIHYVSHSVGELTYIFHNADVINSGGSNQLISEICVTGACDKSYYLEKANEINIRGAVYATLYGSLIYDHGFALAIIIPLIIVFFNTISVLLFRTIGPMTIAFVVILTVASVENYFYTGLGLVQFLLMSFIYNAYTFLRPFLQKQKKQK